MKISQHLWGTKILKPGRPRPEGRMGVTSRGSHDQVEDKDSCHLWASVSVLHRQGAHY